MYEKILNKPESYRKKLAVFSSLFIFMLVVGAWGNVRGFWSNSETNVTVSTEEKPSDTKQLILVSKTSSPTPIQAVRRSFSGVMSAFKESLASVFVPFITGIEVYNSEK